MKKSLHTIFLDMFWNVLFWKFKKIPSKTAIVEFLLSVQSTTWHMHTVPLTIWHHLFLEVWLVDTWIFAHWRHQRAVSRLENVRQLNIRWGKKLVFQLSQKHPPYAKKDPWPGTSGETWDSRSRCCLRHDTQGSWNFGWDLRPKTLRENRNRRPQTVELWMRHEIRY